MTGVTAALSTSYPTYTATYPGECVVHRWQPPVRLCLINPHDPWPTRGEVVYTCGCRHEVALRRAS